MALVFIYQLYCSKIHKVLHTFTTCKVKFWYNCTLWNDYHSEANPHSQCLSYHYWVCQWWEHLRFILLTKLNYVMHYYSFIIISMHAAHWVSSPYSTSISLSGQHISLKVTLGADFSYERRWDSMSPILIKFVFGLLNIKWQAD